MTSSETEALLAPFEREPLGHWPTPLQPLERLSKALGGPQLWLKRDDCSGLGYGGNKTRKLEYLLGDARTIGVNGAGTIITVGGVQSNHACQTAAAAARLGMACHLVLVRVVPGQSEPYETAGNIPAEKIFGATVHVVDDDNDAANLIVQLMEDANTQGRPASLIPAGGSTPIGALGFVNAACELVAQEKARGRAFDRIVLAVSTAGTLSGLATGLAMCSAERPLEAMMVYNTADHLKPVTENLIHQTTELLKGQPPNLDMITFHNDCLGAGYGIPDEATNDAVKLLGRTEGVLIDPVYTGKAFAGLIDLIKRKAVHEGEEILFWHTGGAAVLSAYPQIV